jgi:retinol dehydrogenase-14
MDSPLSIVTGATSGIGKSTAQGLAEKGYRVILACRQAEKAEKVLQEIRAKTPQAYVEFIPCDLADLGSIRSFVQTFLSRYSALHLLVNNAGVCLLREEKTVEGFEKTFGVNHLGHFLLTLLLLPCLEHSEKARIVNVSSQMHEGASVNFLEEYALSLPYYGVQAYRNSKLANILFTYKLSRMLSKTSVNAVHPGMVATAIWPTDRLYSRCISWWIKRFHCLSPEEGAKTSLYVATASELEGVTGKYFRNPQKEVPSSSLSYDQYLQEALWSASLKAVGLEEIFFFEKI